MKLANVRDRAVIVTAPGKGIDVATASRGAFGPDPRAVLADWTAFRTWARTPVEGEPDVAFEPDDLGAPSPAPAQILGIGLNYRDHAEEAGFEIPGRLPPVFVKFRSSLSGPRTTVELPPGGRTDWEVELVVVIGREASRVARADAWDVVAGLSAGQDLSERVSQLAGPAPQFSLGKSFPGFAPVGPWLVTPDEVDDRDDLALGGSVNGTVVQDARTSQLLFPVAALIEKITATITLYPGDLVFTGTPAGIGAGREPQWFLQPGDVLESWVEGIGTLRQTFTETEA
jgi:2-keto-4-pentenoate hydratase/2-oxohepta-3-ene-1,7-dioic acid hydratase in catechol pathway